MGLINSDSAVLVATIGIVGQFILLLLNSRKEKKVTDTQATLNLVAAAEKSVAMAMENNDNLREDLRECRDRLKEKERELKKELEKREGKNGK